MEAGVCRPTGKLQLLKTAPHYWQTILNMDYMDITNVVKTSLKNLISKPSIVALNTGMNEVCEVDALTDVMKSFLNIENLGAQCIPKCGGFKCGGCPIGGRNYAIQC